MTTPITPPETTVTGEQLVAAVSLRGATGTTALERGEQLLAQAVEVLEEALEGMFRPMPVSTYDECVITVAQALNDRRKAPGNAQTTSTDDTAGARAPRDPLAGVRSILDRYVARFA